MFFSGTVNYLAANQQQSVLFYFNRMRIEISFRFELAITFLDFLQKNIAIHDHLS